MIPTKPYKLTTEDLPLIKFPCYVQPKYDGIRCVIWKGRALSYTLKPIKNDYIRTTLERELGKWGQLIDGELMLESNATFQDIQSAVMTKKGEPKFRYVVFDTWQGVDPLKRTFEARFAHEWALTKYHAERELSMPWLQFSYSVHTTNLSSLLVHEQFYLNNNYEGMIIRSPDAPYKFGRSTLNEGYLLALKRFVDAECKIIGFEPFEQNTNEPELDHHGHQKRSSAKDGKVKLPLLGAFIVEGINGAFEGVQFNVGSGFTYDQRRLYWQQRPQLLNKVGTYKYFTTGVKDKPRQPIWKGFRNE